ncbi:MAG: domain S-box protein, partial [Mucilaginibacter sp.]|nr:domain S-box protein [Mucilaginibacter sp.]
VLVSDLLDVSKMQTGKLELSMETFNLYTLLADTVEIVQPLSATHQIILNSDFEQLPVYADKQRMEQVIINLLTNAIKYSPKACKVNVSVYKSDNDITVVIKDFGIGIPIEHQQQIFSRFFRAEGLAPYMSGLGLGLYISKEIIDRHKGRIGVRSEPDNGSEFYFSIPFTGKGN